MYWLIPIILACISSYVLQPILNKKISGLPSRTRNLCWQYCFAAIFANTLALVSDIHFFEDQRIIVIVIIGIFNALGAYCYWRAIAISLSETSLFAQADGLIAMFLGFFILGESQLFNFGLGIGIIFLLCAVFLFVMAGRDADFQYSDIIFYPKKGIGMWIVFFCVIWGIAIFSMRYFALGGMPLLNYVAGWYGGSFIGALIVFSLAGGAEAGRPLLTKDILRILPLSLTIWVSLMLGYWARQLTPLIVSQPIFQIVGMILPTVIGLWVFKEIKELNLFSRAAIVIGLVGGTIIALSW